VEFDRQEIPNRSGRPLPPQRVPEKTPPLLGDWFIYLSVVVLICGVIVITVLNFGGALTDPIVRLPALLGVALLVPLSADAALRSWRSVGSWLPVDRGRAMFRVVWAIVLGAITVVSSAAVIMLLTL
jgi:hypothetical protein